MLEVMNYKEAIWTGIIIAKHLDHSAQAVQGHSIVQARIV